MVLVVKTIDMIYHWPGKIDDVIYGWPLCSRDFSTEKKEYYLELVYKPHFETWILLLGQFGKLRAVKKKNQFKYFLVTFESVFFNLFIYNIPVSTLKSYIIFL